MPKILIPLDSSATSTGTLAGARAIMGQRPWTVRLLYAGADPEGLERAHLESVADGMRAEGHFPAVVMTGGNNSAKTIVRASVAPKMDVVVLPHEARADADSWLTAAVALEVAEQVQFCPVLLMQRSPANDGWQDYAVRQILVPLDGSTTAELGVDVALGLSERLGARITVVVAVSPEPSGAAAASPSPDGENAEPALRDEADAQSYLDGLTERHRDRIRFGRVVADGVAEEAIISAAAAQRADLIAMTTHGTRGTVRTGLGLVARAVARASSVPVMLVRPTGAEARFGSVALLRGR